MEAMNYEQLQQRWQHIITTLKEYDGSNPNAIPELTLAYFHIDIISNNIKYKLKECLLAIYERENGTLSPLLPRSPRTPKVSRIPDVPIISPDLIMIPSPEILTPEIVVPNSTIGDLSDQVTMATPVSDSVISPPNPVVTNPVPVLNPIVITNSVPISNPMFISNPIIIPVSNPVAITNPSIPAMSPVITTPVASPRIPIMASSLQVPSSGAFRIPSPIASRIPSPGLSMPRPMMPISQTIKPSVGSPKRGTNSISSISTISPTSPRLMVPRL